jgi:protein ImuB
MATAIAELPVAALRLTPNTVGGLSRVGIERIGQLAAMPSAPLTRRFGFDVRRRLNQALGHAAEPFDALIPPEVIRRRLVFVEPLGDPDDLARVVGRLCFELCEELSKRGVGARRLDLRPGG